MDGLYRDYDPAVCLNCETVLDAGTRFCPSCGQRNRQHKRSLFEWITEGLATFFHVEGRTWNTVRDLVRPGLVANNYLNGQRQRYVHPLRLLLLGSLLFFGAIAYLDDFEILDVELDSDDDGLEVAVNRNDPAPTKADSIQVSYPEYQGASPAQEAVRGFIDGASGESQVPVAAVTKPSEEATDSTNSDDGFYVRFDGEDSGWTHPLAERMKVVDQIRGQLIAYDMLSEVLGDYDSLSIAAIEIPLVDTLKRRFAPPEYELAFGVGTETVVVNSRSLAADNPDKLASRLIPDGSVMRPVLAKVVRLFQSGSENLNEYLLRNLSWSVLLFVPILALGYKVLYRRRLTYYSQALSFTAINMSVVLIVSAIVLPVAILFQQPWMVPTLGIGLAIYVLLSEAYAFNYPLWKVMLKALALVTYGMIAFIIATLLWLVLVVLLL